ncbi:hypothetical protein [Pseudoneobacillus sp. C159]
MKKWAISAGVYLLVVVGAFYAYAANSGENLKEASHGNSMDQHNSKTEHSDTDKTEPSDEHTGDNHGDGHSEHGENHGDSEVLAMVHDEAGNLFITLKDKSGDPVSDIEVNHEKLMHLIVVSTDLNDYYHLHPDQVEPGVFKTPHTLTAGSYKIFVDIKPKDLAYQVQPISFILGNPVSNHDHSHLQLDTSFVKKVGEHQATLQMTSLKVKEATELKFDLNGEFPEQHLGALGHVVIIDEKANNYLHVHPQHGDKPIFETTFTEPGIYKIWAEFKFDGEVFTFPYVIEVK